MQICAISIILVVLSFFSTSQTWSMNITKQALPKIEANNGFARRAENFLLSNQIKNVQRLVDSIYNNKVSQTQDWLLVAKTYWRLNTDDSIKLALLIYYHIQVNNNLDFNHRSTALIALSKIVADTNPAEALQFARDGRDIDHSNPRAWQRLGDLVLDIEEKRQAYKTMWSLAIIMRDDKLRIRALARLADTCEQNIQWEEARQYYTKVLVLNPNHKIAKNGLQRVKQMQKRLQIR